MSVQYQAGVSRPCRFCGCPLKFVKTSVGSVIPLDARAVVYEVKQDLTGEQIATRVENCYVSHFVSCPRALEAQKLGRSSL